MQKNTFLKAGLLLVIPMLICILWLYQTHSPSEKVYTSDRQYSYYLEEYNYNIITKKILSVFHETEYKVFLYDEITGKKLYSGYAGGKTLLRDYFGFDEEYSQFHLTKPDYIKLPRPIDEKAIEQQKRRERAVNDSIRWAREREQAKEKYYNQPLMTEQEIDYIQPVIKRWTDYYEIDLSQVRLREINSRSVNNPPDTTGFYYLDFRPEDDSSTRVEMSYSPNKQLYVDIGVLPEKIDGKYYDSGEYDVDQAVYLTDRKQKHKNILFFNGPSEQVQDVFWKDNDVFITVGVEVYGSSNKYVIHIFNLIDNTQKQYELWADQNPYTVFDSYHDVYLKAHNILPMKK